MTDLRACAFAYHPTTRRVILVKAGEVGCVRIDTRRTPEDLNAEFDPPVTVQEAAAVLQAWWSQQPGDEPRAQPLGTEDG
jgi:hypothetical protein